MGEYADKVEEMAASASAEERKTVEDRRMTSPFKDELVGGSLRTMGRKLMLNEEEEEKKD